MQLILREDVTHLGEVGDVVNVKAGYARNYLLPRGLAVQANERQMNRLQHEKRIIDSQVAKLQEGALAQKAAMDTVELVIEKAAGENEKLFGSVTTMELEALIRKAGYDIDRRKILLRENIKTLGEHIIGIKLHRDVIANIKVNVVARQEEE